MDLALTRAGLQVPPNSTSVLRSWPGNEHGLQGAVRAGAVGAVVVHRAARVAGRVTGGHFYCLRLHHPTGQWWNLDSLQPPVSGPQMLSAQEVASHLQRESRTHAPPAGAILLYSVPALDPVSHPVGSLASAQPPGHRPDPPGDSQPGSGPGPAATQPQGAAPGVVSESGAGVQAQRSLEVRTEIGSAGAEPGPYLVVRMASRHVTSHALKVQLTAMSDQRSTSLSYAAAGGIPAIPSSLRSFVAEVARSFVLDTVVVEARKGTLDVYLLDGTAKLALQPGPPGHIRTYTVLQGEVEVHQVGVEWPRASTLVYPADAAVPEVSRVSGDPLLLVTTHPTNVSSQLIPSAQLTYVRRDTPGAHSADPLAQVVVTILRNPPRVRLSPSSGRSWDLDPRLLHKVAHAGALTVQVKLSRGVKRSLCEEDWAGWQDPWRSWLAEGDPGGTSIALQFPGTQREDSLRAAVILGAAIPDSVEKRSFVVTTHPSNRKRRSEAEAPEVHDRRRGVHSRAVSRGRGPPGDPGEGPGDPPPQAPTLSGNTQGTPPEPLAPAPPPEGQSGPVWAGPRPPGPPPLPVFSTPEAMDPHGDLADPPDPRRDPGPVSEAGSPGGGRDRSPPQAEPGTQDGPLTPNLPATRRPVPPQTPASHPTPSPQAAELPPGAPRT